MNKSSVNIVFKFTQLFRLYFKPFHECKFTDFFNDRKHWNTELHYNTELSLSLHVTKRYLILQYR